MTANAAASARGERIWADGHVLTIRATRAIQAAQPPASHASAVAAPGRTGSIADAASDSAINGRHRRLCRDVRRDGPQRDGAEVEPHDRRGDEPARERDHEHVPQPPRHRVCLGHARDPREDDEDRGDRGERELEPRLQRGRRRPREEHERPGRERVPAVARTGGDPAERREDARDGSADDRGLPADRQRVREHDDDRDAFTGESPDPGDPRDGDHPDRGDRDVLSRDREQMGQPARLERVSQRPVDPVVLAEHDPGQDRAALPRRATGERRSTCACSRSATPPIPPRRPTTRGSSPRSTTWMPCRASHRAFVEAGLGPSRLDRPRTQLEHGSLRRRPLGRQLEQHALAQTRLAEAHDLRRGAQRERRPAHGAGHDDTRAARASPTWPRERAPVERVDAQRAPPEPDERERRAGERDTLRASRRHQRAAGEDADRREEQRGRQRQPHGERSSPRRPLRRAAPASSLARGASRRHQVAQLLDPCRADARDRIEIVDGARTARAQLASRRSSGRSRARSRELVQLLHGRRREADLGAGAAGSAAGARAGSPAGPSRAPARRPAARRRAAPRG